jgi:hypothetical protein
MMSADVRALNSVIRAARLSNDLCTITCLFFVIALIADDRNSVEGKANGYVK